MSNAVRNAVEEALRIENRRLRESIEFFEREVKQQQKKIAELTEAEEDATLLLGYGWQETLKRVNGEPSTALQHQLAKVVGEHAELQDKFERLKEENERLVEFYRNTTKRHWKRCEEH